MTVSARCRSLALLASLLLAYASVLAVLAVPQAARADEAAPPAARAAATKVRLTATTPEPVAVGDTVRSKVTLKNGTSKALKKVKVSVKVSGSTTVTSRVKKIRKIRGGTKKTFGVTLVAGTEPKATVTLLARAGGKRVATTRFKVRITGGSTIPTTSSLVGRYFALKGINSDGDRELYFGDGFVNEDVPSEAYATCAAVTPDCEPYTYDPATGALTVGAEQGSVDMTTSELILGGEFFQEAVLQQPGARYDVTLSASYLNGACPYAGCFFALYDLTLGADGSFSETIQNSLGFLTRTGTYEVISGSRIRTQYVDDKGEGGEEILTIGVLVDPSGSPSPAVEGLMIAGLWFTPDT